MDNNTTCQYLQSHSSAFLKLARCRAPSFASATEKSRAAAVVQPACPQLGLVVYGTSIDRWSASRSCLTGWSCYTGFAFCSCGLKPADMISIAHLASHFLAPGSRVADLNNGEMVCLCYTAVLTRLVVLSFSLTIDHALFTMSATPRDLHEP